MKKSIKILALIFTMLVIMVVGISCKDKEEQGKTPAELISEVKAQVEALEIPETVSASFEDVALYQSNIEGVTVTYSLSENANGYLGLKDYVLSFIALPEENVGVILTANIACGEESDTVEFQIRIYAASTPQYKVEVVALNGRKLPGVIVEFKLNGEKVLETETNDSGVAYALLDAAEYDVTVYLEPGYVFEDGSDIYKTKTDTNFSEINLECIPDLILDPALEGNIYNNGDQMHDFTVQTYDPLTRTYNNTWTLSEKLEEYDLVILNFWYTGCYWCEFEFPILADVYQEYLDAGAKVTILGIANSDYDDNESLPVAAQSYGLNFDLVVDDALTDMFVTSGFPTTAFIDRYGTADYIESGAITNESRWNSLIDTYLAEDYVPEYKGTNGDEPELVVPDIEFPDSSVLETALNKDGFKATYKPETDSSDAEYSWPFIVDEETGYVVPANSGISNSYAIMYVEVELKAGQGFAFDYRSSTEEDMDVLHLLYDGAILSEFSGISDETQTYYPFVADKDGTYEFIFIYTKDQLVDEGNDKVYLSNFRYVNPDEIPETLFVVRESSTDINLVDGGYLNYITPVFNSNDGYYHVGDENGPLLLGDIMSATHFSNDTLLSYAEAKEFEGEINGTNLNDLIIRYSQYAANSLTQGYTPVTEELKQALIAISNQMGTNEDKDKEWLEMTVYFNVYGNYEGDERVNQETGQIIDPTEGLAHHNAFTIENLDIAGDLNDDGSIKDTVDDAVIAGTVEYTMDRFITTRGFYFVFVPEFSGVYRVIGKTGGSTDCYIELPNYEIYAQSNFEIRDYYRWAASGSEVGDFNTYAYLEAGQTYYVVPYYTNYGEFGNVNMDIEYLGTEYVVLEKASSFAYTTSEDFTGEGTGNIEDIIISIGIDYALGEDGYYHELYSDGTLSKDPIYWDMIYSNMLINMPFAEAMEADPTVFDVSKTQFGDSIIDEEGYLIEWEYTENPTTGETTKESHRVLDDAKQPIEADTTVLRDYMNDVKKWREELEVKDENNSAYGCIPVNEEVKTLLELLMNKYSFKDVEGSWLKLCYYYKYYGASEHATETIKPAN